MTTRFFSFFVLLGLASCTKGEAVPSTTSSSSAQGGGGSSAAGSAGATTMPAAGSQQGNAAHGGKGTGDYPLPTVRVNTVGARTDQAATASVRVEFSPTYDLDFRWEPLLTASIYFIDDRGDKIALSPELMMKPGQYGWPEGQLTPASPLEFERWYSLKIEPKGYYLWGTFNWESFLMSTKPLEIRLFTGSAPFLQRADITNTGDYLRMYFSEEIEVSETLRGIEVWSGGQMVKGCLDDGGVCRQSDTVWKSLGVGYHLEGYTGAPLELKLPSSIKGTTRTFGEAAALFGLPTDGAGNVTYQITWEKDAQGVPVWVHPRIETNAK